MFRKTNHSVTPPTVFDRKGTVVERPDTRQASRLPGDPPAQKQGGTPSSKG